MAGSRQTGANAACLGVAPAGARDQGSGTWLGEPAADPHRLDSAGQPGRVVGHDKDAAQRRLALGDLRLLARHLGHKAAHRRRLLHADHRIVVAAHPGIADDRRCRRAGSGVGGRDMRVRADHRRDAAVGEMADRHLLARRLGVEIDDDRGRTAPSGYGREDRVEPRERVVERVHEQPAHQIDRPAACGRRRPVQPPAGARASPAGNWPGAGCARRARYTGSARAGPRHGCRWSGYRRRHRKARRAIFSVRPKPCAAFSALTIATSIARSRRNPGRCAATASRPARPTTSPQHEDVHAGQLRLKRESGWSRLGRRLATPPWPCMQVGAMYRSHDSDRDSSQEVDIGPGV